MAGEGFDVRIVRRGFAMWHWEVSRRGSMLAVSYFAFTRAGARRAAARAVTRWRREDADEARAEEYRL